MHGFASSISIQDPSDLKKMSLPELQALAEDARQTIITACLRNGGHLGASLGAVELAIALHFVFDSPREPLVWDVGHQAYAHKLLTGRWDRFQTLRQTNGISGFLSREESPHDVFGAGHSSTALSAALAMAYARSGSDDWSVAIVGDGGLTAGVAFEALNNAHIQDAGPLLIVLNDNQMSISENVGGLAQAFASGRARELCDLFAMEYVGPVDGHDLGTLIGTLQGIRASNRRGEKPIFLHVLTQKGKGYGPAEESPSVFHGVGPVQAKVAGESASVKQKTYSDVFGETLCQLAEADPKIVAITAAMPEGTGLTEFARRFPDRFFDVGIAEPHAVTFAAGLATQGLRPVVAIYSTFLQRSLDAIIHDVALQRLGVVFAVDRAGLVGADGPTHHGAFDLAYCGMVPGIRMSAPTCLSDLTQELSAALSSGEPWMIRYPRGGGEAELSALSIPELGRSEGLRVHQLAKRPRVVVVGFGHAASKVIRATKAEDPQGERVTVISVTRLKPFPQALLTYLQQAPQATILTVEEGVLRGGAGQALAAELSKFGSRVVTMGYPESFIPHGGLGDLEKLAGVSVEQIAQRIREHSSEKSVSSS